VNKVFTPAKLHTIQMLVREAVKHSNMAAKAAVDSTCNDDDVCRYKVAFSHAAVCVKLAGMQQQFGIATVLVVRRSILGTIFCCEPEANVHAKRAAALVHESDLRGAELDGVLMEETPDFVEMKNAFKKVFEYAEYLSTELADAVYENQRKAVGSKTHKIRFIGAL
jgi:hypothetical protein